MKEVINIISLDDVKLTTNGKNYSFRINKDLRYRIELIVE